MASAQFYELEDLCATLLYSLRTVNSSLAFHVAYELEASGEHELLFRFLTFAWFLAPPGLAYEPYIAQIVAQNDPSKWKELVGALLETEPYMLPTFHEPVVIPLPRPSHAPLDAPWSPFPSNYTPYTARTFYRAVNYAVKQGFWEHAAYLTHSLLPTNPASACSLLACMGVSNQLVQLLESTVYAPLQPRIVEHLYAALCMRCSALPQPRPRIPKPSPAFRPFTISKEAYAEWNIKPKSETRLSSPAIILEDKASAVWKARVEQYKIAVKDGSLVFPTEARMEEFYTTCFPHDIPDEWSPEERQKSHGGGLVTTEQPKNPWKPAFHLCC